MDYGQAFDDMCPPRGCECFVRDPSTWFYYVSAVEPGSQLEWNPDCPVHGDTPIERETAHALGYYATGRPVQ
tara:strand:+ start:410 stop:625 length:216 start_codon:yes stop_codon:yes gene_type:complete